MYIDGNRVRALVTPLRVKVKASTPWTVMGIKDADRAVFASAVKSNFATVLPISAFLPTLKSVLLATARSASTRSHLT